MTVNSAVDFISTVQSASNTSGEQFYECMDSYPGNWIISVSIIVSVSLFLPLNCWILWLMSRNKSVASSDFVMFNQTISEIICGFSLTVFLAGTLRNKKVVILIANYLCSTFLVGRPLFQTFFCVERYLAVVHPLVYLHYTKAIKLKALFVGLVWLIILMFGLYTAGSYPKLPVWIFVGIYLAMLVVCSSCSLRILWVLKRNKPGDGEKAGAYQQKKKAFVAVTVILVTLLFSYGPIASAFFLRSHLPYHTFCLVTGISWCMFAPSSAIQPYLYLSKINKLPCIRNV